MKILYDHQIFQAQQTGGISRYFFEVMSRTSEMADFDVELSLKYSHNEYLKFSEFEENVDRRLHGYAGFLPGREFKAKWLLYLWHQRLTRPVNPGKENIRISIELIKKQDFDVFHPTYYGDYFLPYIGSKPFVLTVYDMIHEIYPEYFKLGDTTSKRKLDLARKAAKIIAISNRTKQDLIDIFEIPEDKIQVIHLANSIHGNSGAELLPPKLPERYLLFVGGRPIYKNFYFFIKSVAPILASDRTLHIVCAGSPFEENESTFFAQHQIADRVHAFPVSDAGLGMLYRRALALVYPSLYEGFGLPVLEAFANSCPALLANAGSLPEVGGESAIYFEPKNAGSLRHAVATVLSDVQARAKLADKGRERVELFSWDRTAHETAALYRTLA